MRRKVKDLWKLLFGRTTILGVLLLAQIFFMIGGAEILGRQFVFFSQLVGIISFLIIFYILNNKQNSSFKLTWIILILVAPVLGVLFYVFTRLQPGTRYVKKELEDTVQRQKAYLRQDAEVLDKLQNVSKRTLRLSQYLHDSGNYPTYNNTQVRYFPSGEAKYEELLIQLEQAKSFIFMEYFIVERGKMWNSILEILERKAKEGVEVRFMYDGTNSLSLLPPYYSKTLEEKGIQCKVFAPMLPFLSTHQNNRDHRKIVVIDGHTAFTGGINLADEYINEVERFGHWKDTAVMVKGVAVKSFTLMFLQLWDLGRKEHTEAERYILDDYQMDPLLLVEGFVAPYSDSPYDDENVGERVYMDILYSAKDYVHIMTPYLILDEEMVEALMYSAKSGVEVIIIMPHVPDKEYAYMLARTYYRRLITAGVQIYEYTPGFVHAKVFTSDDKKAVVGTINLDFRSLYLHFEDAVFLYRHPEISKIETDFQETLKMCRKMTLDDCKNYPIIKKLAGAVLRIIAPLM